MTVRSGQSVTVEFTTSNPSTQVAVNADSTPTGTLVVNGTDNGAAVTVTNVDAGRYKAAVTLPTLAVGDVVEILIAATVAAAAGKEIVWRDTKDVLLDASGKTTDGVQTGDSYAVVNSGTFGNAAIKGYVDDIGVAGAGLTALGDARLANLDAAVSSRSTYAGGDTAGTTTLLSRVTGAVALASQIPANFTSATFASAGVFSVGALANAPTGGGGGGGDVNVVSVNGTTFAGPNVPCVLADGVAHGGTPGGSTATLAFSQIVGVAQIDNTTAFSMTGAGSGSGGLFMGGASGDGLINAAGGSVGTTERGHGMLCTAAPSSGAAGSYSKGGGAGGPGWVSEGGPAASGVQLLGGLSGGSGLSITGTGDGAYGVTIDHSDAGAFTGVRIQGANGGHDVLLAGSGDVWDGAYGRPVQVLSDRVMLTGVLDDQSGAPGTSGVILPSGPAAQDALLGARLRITAGTGQYQERTVVYWSGAAGPSGPNFAGSDWPWTTKPASGDSFAVLYDNAPQLLDGAYASVSVGDFQSRALAQLFTLDSTKAYADAVAGSVVKEIATNAAGGGGGGADPWATAQPGAYGAGTYGHLVAADLPAILGKLNAAGLVITSVNTVPADGGPIRLVAGDDYAASEGLTLGWNSNSTIDYAGATVSLDFYASTALDAPVSLSKPGAVTGSVGAWLFSVNLTAADTALITATPLRRKYALRALLANGHRTTPIEGEAIVTT